MPRFRSYNEEFLIRKYFGSDGFLNDIEIDRRKHGIERDYSKVVRIKDIIQKKFEVPCIFGDRGIILKSLENYSGAIQLPLYILSTGSIKADPNRNADLHVDIFYQQDPQFYKLDPSDPHYKKYELSKRRGLPVTIDYSLTLVTKYREDLDQMCTNWMVHMRPDVYFKWWHPREKSVPLESELLWDQSISYDGPDDFDPTVKFQYKATTNFTLKTWIFTGLNVEEDMVDPDSESLIYYFNWFPISGDDAPEGYPVLGEFGYADVGFYAIDSKQEFTNDGSDVEGILSGKYFENNLMGVPSSLYPDGPKITEPDIVGDILTKDRYSNLPEWKIYQDYCRFDKIMNERCALKAIYFAGGFPMSAMSVTPPSGDFLFQHFYSDNFKHLNPSAGYCPEIYEEEFGMCYTESMPVCYNYDVYSKDFTAKGICRNDRYNITIQSTMNSISGYTQMIQVENIPIAERYIKMEYTRSLDIDLNKIELPPDRFMHINLWNNHPKSANTTPVTFLFETEQYKKTRSLLHEIIKAKWNKIELVHCTDDDTPIRAKHKDPTVHYFIDCDDMQFWKGLKTISKQEEIRLMNVKCDINIDGNHYIVIANNYYYFVLKNDEIYDWGIVMLPRFESMGHPVFNVVYPDGKLIYGISVDMSIGSW